MRAAAAALMVGMLIILAWLIRPALLVVTLAAVYAFVTWPLTRSLSRRAPTAFVALVVNIGVAMAIAGAALAGGPYLYAQMRSLLAEMPAAFMVMLQSLPVTIHGELDSMVRRQNGSTIAAFGPALLVGFGFARSAVGAAGAAILIPVLAAYLQFDKPRYERALFSLVPAPRQDALRRLFEELSGVARGFIRAQLLVSGIVGLLVYVVLLLTGVPFAPAIALLTATADLVPYLGGVAAFIPSLLLAVALGGIWKALLVAALLIAVFEVEAQLLQPQIVGSRTHLPPSAIVIALLVGGTLFGIVGLYVAVPVAASVPPIVRFIQGGKTSLARAGTEARK